MSKRLNDNSRSSIYFIGANSKEFASHNEVAKTLSIDVYFAKPYASWQRGTNENMEGLINQYLPRPVRLDDVTIEQIQLIEQRLNNKPD